MKEHIIKTLTLGDGTVLKDSYCGYSGDRNLWCFISGKTMMECMQIFSDPYKTSSIISYFYDDGMIYKGFTELLLIQKSSDTVDVRLTWPEGHPHSAEKIEEEPESDINEQ